MAATEQIDEALSSGLKQAKTKRMYFALVVKGGSDGALLICKTKVPPADITAAKKRCGGSAVIQGACFGEGGKLIFEVAQPASASVAQVVKTVAKRDGGQGIVPEFRLGTSPDLLDGNGVAPLEQPDSAKDTTPGLATLDAIKLVAANGVWKQSRDQAIDGMSRLEGTLRGVDNDAADEVADIIAEIAKNFPRSLDGVLDQLAQAARAGDASASKGLQSQAQQGIKECLAYLKGHGAELSACEENPFSVGIQVQKPLTDALRDILLIIK